MLVQRPVDAREAAAVHPGVEEPAVQQRQLSLRASGNVDRERVNVQVVLRLELDADVRELLGKLVQRPTHRRTTCAGRMVVGQPDDRLDPLRRPFDLDDLLDDPFDDLLNFPGHDLLNDLLDRHFHDLLNLNDLLNRNFLPYDPFDLLGYDLLDLLSDDLLDLNFFDDDPVDRDFPGHHLRLAAGRQRYRTGNPQGGGAAHAKHLSSCNHFQYPLPP